MGLLDLLFGPRPGSTLPEYRRDHQIPERRLVHAFLAFYTGDDGDPRYTLGRSENVAHLQEGWGLADARALVALMDRYEQDGECNVAFDLIRVIKLARHGVGAGWVSDGDGWEICLRCTQRLKQTYARWEEVYLAFQAGREQWWTERRGRPCPREESQNYARRYSEASNLVLSKLRLNP